VRLAHAIATLLWPLACVSTAADFEFLPAGAAHYSVPVRSLQELRFRTTVKQKYDFSCGSAALATLLTYHYEQRVDEAMALNQMFVRGDQQKIRREGFSMLDMKRYLGTFGFEADGYQVDVSQLAKAGVPAIALLNWNGYRHFVVVKGIADQQVLIGDPSRGTRTMARQQFEASQTGIFLVIRNRADTAREHFNDSREWRAAGRIPLDQALERPGLEWRVATIAR
jgi:hypothetical protein